MQILSRLSFVHTTEKFLTLFIIIQFKVTAIYYCHNKVADKEINIDTFVFGALNHINTIDPL